MKKRIFHYHLFIAICVTISLSLVSCGSDEDLDTNEIATAINDDGTTNNSSILCSIDEKHFCIDYVYYTVNEDHLVVTSCNKALLKGVANIVSSITYKGNTYSVTAIDKSVFEYCYDLNSVIIPHSVTSIGESSFRSCIGLTSVTIPNSVTSIGVRAFEYCISLTSVTSLNTTPPQNGYDSFDTRTLKNAVLHVPEGCKTVYQQAYGWSDFLNIQDDIVLSSSL